MSDTPSPHGTWHEAEDQVKLQLWRHGYKVRRANRPAVQSPYDLIVDEDARVQVKSTRLGKDNRWTFSFSRNEADVFAFVFFYPDGMLHVRYLKRAQLQPHLKKRSRKPTLLDYHVVHFKNPHDSPLLRKSVHGIWLSAYAFRISNLEKLGLVALYRNSRQSYNLAGYCAK